MIPLPEVDKAFWERVERARRMSPEEKLFAGVRLFEEECEKKRNELRRDFPAATPETIEALLQQHYDEERRRENAGIYFPVPP